MATRITEKYEYRTNIITAYNGQEQRIATRYVPRHQLSYDYDAMDSWQAQWLRSLLRMKQNSAVYFPMWHTPVTLSHDKYFGEHILKINPECMYALRGCDAIEIWVEDASLHDIERHVPSQNITKFVESYGNAQIDLGARILKEFNKLNTWIYPLRKCSVQPSQEVNYVFSNGTNVTINIEDLMEKVDVEIPDEYLYEYEEDKFLNIYNLPKTVNGVEVMTFTPQWLDDADYSLTLDKNVEKMDNETGIFVYDIKGTKVYDLHNMKFFGMNRRMINNIIRFFHRMKGRLKSFYAPTWVNDFNIYQDIYQGSQFIFVVFNNMNIFFGSTMRPRKLVIFTKDKQSHIFDILSYGDAMLNGNKVGRLVLTNPVEKFIAKDNILMASFFERVRFDKDDLQLDYESDAVAQVEFVLKEVDDL